MVAEQGGLVVSAEEGGEQGLRVQRDRRAWKAAGAEGSSRGVWQSGRQGGRELSRGLGSCPERAPGEAL